MRKRSEVGRERQVDVKYDKEKKEYYKMVSYRDAAKGAKPNKFYKQVFEDNNKFSFEKDIYSIEFFKFTLNVI